MKKTMAIISGVTAVVCGCTSGNNVSGNINREEVISSLSLEDKAHFVIGTGMDGVTGDDAVIGSTKSIVPGAAGTTYALDSLGIPAIVLADGPAGLRIDATREGDDQTYYCTHFPIGTLLASMWNTQLVRQVGTAMGQEAKEYGADVLLAPALNIMRNPLCGRNFEYYSEDPVVAGKTASAYIQGVQANGVGTSIKHFAANSQETNRMKTDAHISQRALREIYLKGFEIAIKESKPWTVMTSYNYVNGVYTSESRELNTTVLRDEWGYEGTVMSDWYGGKDGALQMWAGNDMLQPGRQSQFDSIVAAVKSGRLAEADLDRNMGRILSLIEKTPRYQGYPYSNKPDLKAHAEVTRQSAAEGMVLMKNNPTPCLAALDQRSLATEGTQEENPSPAGEGSICTLPFSSDIKRVALYGTTSYEFIAGGTGSGNVNHAYVVSLLDGLKNGGYAVDEGLRTAYGQYWADYKEQLKKQAKEANGQEALVRQFLGDPLPAEKLFSLDELKAQAAAADVAILTIGRVSGEFFDRSVADFSLSDSERQLLEQVCAVYHEAGKSVVVLLNIGGVIETNSWKHLPDAILCAWQAGQEGGNSVVDVLSGKQVPSGKFTMTWPVRLEDVASSKNFPMDQKQELDLYNRDASSAGVRNVDFTDYEEDIYVGYRYFDAFDVPVSYPFGFGLSYTTFEYGDAKMQQTDDAFEVSVTVTNTGKREGKEVVQLYVAAPDSKAANKPVKELKAFAKTRLLQPGESETVRMTVPATDLASFDEAASAWVVAEGEYQFLVGASSQDVKAVLTATAKGRTTKVNDVLKPQSRLNLLRR